MVTLASAQDAELLNITARATIVGWKAVGDAFTHPIRNVKCRRPLNERNGPGFFCKHCDVDAVEVDNVLSVAWILDDGTRQITAIGRQSVSHEILGISPNELYYLADAERRRALRKATGTEWLCSLSYSYGADREIKPQIYLDSVVPARDPALWLIDQCPATQSRTEART
ncbi:hypothetical protein DFJ74DRAFT_149704 [Hyaloraphidium curvatum]|nr:hypothetical protein DFJ74DRAFT_149704 [Hyaloraphidium curvatum]